MIMVNMLLWGVYQGQGQGGAQYVPGDQVGWSARVSSFSRQRVMMARMFGSGVIPGYLELGCFR